MEARQTIAGAAPRAGRPRRRLPLPGCGSRRFVAAHHIRHWAHGGSTDLSDLVQVCRHHHRLLHEGGYTVRSRRDGDLSFQRPDGRRIPACPSVPRGHVTELTAPPRHGPPRAPAIRPDACLSLSAGERLDLGLGVEALLAFATDGQLVRPLR